MARHNREGVGVDQHGFEYQISYQPDCLRHVKVSRELRSGRQSTMTLFRNPAERRERSPGSRVRTRITCADQGVDVEVTVRCPDEGVCRFTVTCVVPAVARAGTEEMVFTIENGLPSAAGRVVAPGAHG